MREIIVKSVLNKKKKRDSWFLDDYTLNPYEGCSFNCQYCYVRGSKYGENMEDTLAVKINGPEILARQLAFRTNKNQHGIIALASATDPYIRAEEKYSITRRYLQEILRFQFPVLMITKSTLILRDLDFLKEIDREAIHANDLKSKMTRGAIISFSFSTLDERIASALEPGAPSPKERLRTMKACKDAGLFVGMNCMPVLPYISDTREELEKLIIAAQENGADYILIGGLTLFGNNPSDSKTLYFKFLERNFPEHVKSCQDLYGNFFYPPKWYLDRLNKLANELCSKYGIRQSIISPP
jgi:DNA repair photolyase